MNDKDIKYIITNQDLKIINVLIEYDRGVIDKCKALGLLVFNTDDSSSVESIKTINQINGRGFLYYGCPKEDTYTVSLSVKVKTIKGADRIKGAIRRGIISQLDSTYIASPDKIEVHIKSTLKK